MTLDTTTPAAAHAFDIAAIKKLADQAGSDIVTISAPDMVGVPARVPVLLDRVSGAVTNLKPLFDHYRTAPDAKTGKAKTQTLQSFIDLLRYHATDTSVVFANVNWKKPSFLAVIDYHEATDAERIAVPGQAKSGKHRISYEFPFSEEWQAWSNVHGCPISQVLFAEFIEDHISDVCEATDPEKAAYEPLFSARMAAPNELITLSRGLQVFTDTNIKQAIRLQSGETQLVFEEAHKDSTGNKLDVPGMFMLSLPTFFSGDTVRLPVRLRYRVREGVISWSMLLYRPDKVITDAVKGDLETVFQATSLPCFEGEPEA